MSENEIMATTLNYLSGYKIKKEICISMGVIVKSRSVFGNIKASFKALAGGEIKNYTTLMKESRNEAYERMIEDARSKGANAVLNVRYDVADIAGVMIEFASYGTACVVETMNDW